MKMTNRVELLNSEGTVMVFEKRKDGWYFFAKEDEFNERGCWVFGPFPTFAFAEQCEYDLLQ